MNICYLSKNIPTPSVIENKIILELYKKIRSTYEYSIDIFYPREWYPSIFIKYFGPSRLKSLIKYTNKFTVCEVDVNLVDYIRLGKYNWNLSKHIFNGKLTWSMYDVIHSHMVFPDGIIGSELKRKHGIPLVITVRDGDLLNYQASQRNKKLFIECLHSADNIIVLTTRMERFILDLGFSCNVVPNAISDHFFSELTVEKKLNKEIVVAARLVEEKNIDWVIKFANCNPDYVLTIIGDGPYKKNLERLVEGSNVKFLGWLDKNSIRKHYDSASFFVLPSKRESFGIAYIEALSRGCVCIALSGTGTYGDKSSPIKYVDEYEPLEQFIISTNNDSFLKLSKDGIEYAQGFSWGKILSSVSKIYLSVNKDNISSSC